MKKKHTVIALIMGFVMTCPMVAQAGFTPRYDVDMPEIPDIEVELSDATKDAIDKAMETLSKTSESVVTKLYQAAAEQAKQEQEAKKPDVEVKDADAQKAE